MYRNLLALFILTIFSIHGRTQQELRFSADSVKITIADIVKAMEHGHPGFYRYHSKEAFRQYIDSIEHTLPDSLTLMQAYLKIKPIIAHIGCLHTGIVLADKYEKEMNRQANLLPLQLLIKDNRAFVIKNLSGNTGIRPGDEVVSINNQPVVSIISQLLPLIPSDGYNQTMKYRALLYQFPLWYRLLDSAKHFELDIIRNGAGIRQTVAGQKKEDITSKGFLEPEETNKKQLEFSIQGNTGILTIRTFAESVIKRNGQRYKPFIDNAFLQLKEKKISNLVIDLRDNTGGTDEFAVYLARHFFDNPFRYWDRIEVTEGIAKQIKGIHLKLFYRKPVQKDSMWLWQKARHVRDFDFYEEQKPAKNTFAGNTYVLINGFCMSSCADVAAILAHNRKAIFIGEETGGGYQGNTSGMMPPSDIGGFNMVLTVPLQKYTNAVDPKKNAGRGTIPDHIVDPSVDDLINGNDAVMKYMMALINQSR